MNFQVSIIQPYIQIKYSTDTLLKLLLWNFQVLVKVFIPITVRPGIFKNISLTTPRLVS